MKKLLVILTFLSRLAVGQTNLVPNPSFESFTNCPISAGQIDYTGNWYQPTTGTPDYFNACFSFTMAWTSEMDVPTNFIGYQNAFQNGNGYAGIFAWYTYPTPYREYLQTKLTTTLSPSQKYYVTLYVSLSDSSRYTTDDLGLYFSSSPISRNDFDTFTFTPQVSNPSGQFLNDKNNWEKISGSFIASGSEEYLTIGNFKDNNNTDTIRLINQLSTNSDFNGAYYYIEQICVSTDSTLCNVITNILEINKNNSELIYPNPTTGRLVLNLKPNSIIKVLNKFGELVLIKKDFNENEIDLSNYSDGVYFIEIQYNDKSSFKKVVVRH